MDPKVAVVRASKLSIIPGSGAASANAKLMLGNRYRTLSDPISPPARTEQTILPCLCTRMNSYRKTTSNKTGAAVKIVRKPPRIELPPIIAEAPIIASYESKPINSPLRTPNNTIAFPKIAPAAVTPAHSRTAESAPVLPRRSSSEVKTNFQNQRKSRKRTA